MITIKEIALICGWLSSYALCLECRRNSNYISLQSFIHVQEHFLYTDKCTACIHISLAHLDFITLMKSTS